MRGAALERDPALSLSHVASCGSHIPGWCQGQRHRNASKGSAWCLAKAKCCRDSGHGLVRMVKQVCPVWGGGRGLKAPDSVPAAPSRPRGRTSSGRGPRLPLSSRRTHRGLPDAAAGPACWAGFGWTQGLSWAPGTAGRSSLGLDFQLWDEDNQGEDKQYTGGSFQLFVWKTVPSLMNQTSATDLCAHTVNLVCPPAWERSRVEISLAMNAEPHRPARLRAARATQRLVALCRCVTSISRSSHCGTKVLRPTRRMPSAGEGDLGAQMAGPSFPRGGRPAWRPGHLNRKLPAGADGPPTVWGPTRYIARQRLSCGVTLRASVFPCVVVVSVIVGER